MYGTIARFQLKPGMATKLDELQQQFTAATVPGFIAAYVYQMAADASELVQQNGPEAKKIATAIAWRQRNYAKAVHLLEQYTVAWPQDDEGLVFLGEAYLSTNEPDKAIGAFELALRVNPNSEDAKQDLEELRSRLAPEKK